MKRILPVLFMLLITFSARADWNPGPPEEVILLVAILIGIGIFFVSALIYWLLNKLLYRFVTKRIGFPWVQSLLSVVLLAVLVTSDYTYSFLWDIQFEYGSEMKHTVYNSLIFSCFPIGWSLGFFLSPRKKEKKRDKKNTSLLDD